VSTFVLIHGAGDGAWSWHLVAAELDQRGHDVIAVDLPSDDESAGLSEYAGCVIDAIGDRTDLVVVGQSLGGFTAPLVCDRVPVDLLVLVAAMVPSPGETVQEWWSNTGHGEASRGEAAAEDDDPYATFFHDVSPELAAEALRRERPVSVTPMAEPWPLEAWPDVPTKFLLCRDDRMFPADWMRGVVRDRLGFDPDEMDGGHCIALSRPKELADRLDGYVAGR